jgi:DNA-binding NtrC family response regulator
MKDLVVLMDTKSGDWIEVERMLNECNYRIHPVRSLEELEKLIKLKHCQVVLLDLDMVSVHSRFFRLLKAESPHLSILALSERTFHPELKEALTHHICACFRKPLEQDELAFWLKAVAGLRSSAADPADDR